MLATIQAFVTAINDLVTAVALLPGLQTDLTDFDTFLTNLG